MRQNPWSGNYRNQSALELHFESQSEETENWPSVQETERGEKVATGRESKTFSKFANFREDDETSIDLSDETVPIDGQDTQLNDPITSQGTEEMTPGVQTGDKPKLVERKRGRPPKASQPARSENRISSRTRFHSPMPTALCVAPEKQHRIMDRHGQIATTHHHEIRFQM